MDGTRAVYRCCHGVNTMTASDFQADKSYRFLLARYRVTWHRLRGLDHPLRIGDVLVLPITAFSPGGEPDFHSGPPDSPQADVLHNCEFIYCHDSILLADSTSQGKLERGWSEITVL